jgi:hypothetical protein
MAFNEYSICSILCQISITEDVIVSIVKGTLRETARI